MLICDFDATLASLWRLSRLVLASSLITPINLGSKRGFVTLFNDRGPRRLVEASLTEVAVLDFIGLFVAVFSVFSFTPVVIIGKRIPDHWSCRTIEDAKKNAGLWIRIPGFIITYIYIRVIQSSRRDFSSSLLASHLPPHA